MVFGIGAFRKWLGDEGRVLINRISAIKETAGIFTYSFHQVKEQQKDNYLRSEKQVFSKQQICDTLMLAFVGSRIMRSKSLLFIIHSVYSNS